jgi:uncharacterized protein YndB with AHSA1/START domain
MTPPRNPAAQPSTSGDITASDRVAPVRKTITVNAPQAHAFTVFTDGIHRWWPREHHIGDSPAERVIIEAHEGGRCYTMQQDGTPCDWGTVLAWEPPSRVVLAWRITTDWKFETDLWKSSEVEVRFIPESEKVTRVELEHRHLERHGAGAPGMRFAVDSPNGWGLTLQLYATEASTEV